MDATFKSKILEAWGDHKGAEAATKEANQWDPDLHWSKCSAIAGHLFLLVEPVCNWHSLR